MLTMYSQGLRTSKTVADEAEIVEAPSGFEPLNEGFADPSLSHLGTAPRIKRIPHLAPSQVPLPAST